MSEIPGDVIEEATCAYDKLHGIENEDGQEPWREEDIQIIAKAILAERERCAGLCQGNFDSEMRAYGKAFAEMILAPPADERG